MGVWRQMYPHEFRDRVPPERIWAQRDLHIVSVLFVAGKEPWQPGNTVYRTGGCGSASCLEVTQVSSHSYTTHYQMFPLSNKPFLMEGNQFPAATAASGCQTLSLGGACHVLGETLTLRIHLIISAFRRNPLIKFFQFNRICL